MMGCQREDCCSPAHPVFVSVNPDMNVNDPKIHCIAVNDLRMNDLRFHRQCPHFHLARIEWVWSKFARLSDSLAVPS